MSIENTPFDERLLQALLRGVISTKCAVEDGEDPNVDAICSKLNESVPVLCNAMSLVGEIIRVISMEELVNHVEILESVFEGCVAVETLHSFLEDVQNRQNNADLYQRRLQELRGTERTRLERLMRARITEQQAVFISRLKPSIDALANNRSFIMGHFNCFNVGS
jgi:hypothetical protein